MKLLVKILHRELLSIDVPANSYIKDVKMKIEKDLNIPFKLQNLLFLGKTLKNDLKIEDYPAIVEGSKLYLLVKKEETLEVLLERLLRNHLSEFDSKVIVAKFLTRLQSQVNNLNYEDLERLAIILKK